MFGKVTSHHHYNYAVVAYSAYISISAVIRVFGFSIHLLPWSSCVYSLSITIVPCLAMGTVLVITEITTSNKVPFPPFFVIEATCRAVSLFLSLLR